MRLACTVWNAADLPGSGTPSTAAKSDLPMVPKTDYEPQTSWGLVRLNPAAMRGKLVMAHLSFDGLYVNVQD